MAEEFENLDKEFLSVLHLTTVGGMCSYLCVAESSQFTFWEEYFAACHRRFMIDVEGMKGEEDVTKATFKADLEDGIYKVYVEVAITARTYFENLYSEGDLAKLSEIFEVDSANLIFYILRDKSVGVVRGGEKLVYFEVY